MLTKNQWIVGIFSLLYVLGFSVYFALIGDFEFLIYISVLVIIGAVVYFTLPKSKFDNVTLWGLSLWGLFHLIGGGVMFGNDVAYNFVFFEFFSIEDNPILKYDQVLHFLGFGLVAYFSYGLLKNMSSASVSAKALIFFAIFVSMGFGALNEIVEFLATVFVPDTNVGGYVNTGIDVVANGLGAVVGAFVGWYRKQ